VGDDGGEAWAWEYVLEVVDCEGWFLREHGRHKETVTVQVKGNFKFSQ
jgi:hypothetical protein